MSCTYETQFFLLLYIHTRPDFMLSSCPQLESLRVITSFSAPYTNQSFLFLDKQFYFDVIKIFYVNFKRYTKVNLSLIPLYYLSPWFFETNFY